MLGLAKRASAAPAARVEVNALTSLLMVRVPSPNRDDLASGNEVTCFSSDVYGPQPATPWARRALWAVVVVTGELAWKRAGKWDAPHSRPRAIVVCRVWA